MIRRGRSGLPVGWREVQEVMDEEPEVIVLGPEKKMLRIAPDLDPRKKRHFGPEKDKVIRKEVGELLEAGHIREVQFPAWLSNVVLVPKSSGKWRMCVDFRDLNKECPKDCYPLSRIDQLVDSTAGHQYLCMLDAYQGYHQIPLSVEDQDKVGSNVEVYLDDIMVKSKDSTQLIPDLVETFSSLRSYGLKLNPQKYIFGVRSAKFLGYMVTERGIGANPEKVRDIQEMVSPQGPRDVQKLTGKIAVLARFISRSAHRSLPFFRTLHKTKKFEWDSDCEKAFRELKKYLAELPVLAKPAACEPLWVYLSATEGAVSSVLVKLEGSTQQPVYYVSHALKGAEIRYSGLEKLALALWTTELGEYDIQYEPRTEIKAQALADFLAETVHQENEDPWKVYEDGSASKDGNGMGVVLILPAGEDVKLTVRLDFRASNNEAKYEAVLVGLRAARNVGNSQVVAQQMKGIYDVKDEKLIEYAQDIDRVREKFTEITFKQILRKKNEKADTLAKMARAMRSWKTRDVVFQVELTPHTSSPTVEQEKEDWRTVMISYLNDGKLPEDVREARKLKIKCARYMIVGEMLYRRSFAGPLLRCLSYQEADYVLREVHEGCCRNHLEAYVLARKVMLAGYCWPSVLHNAQKLVMSCDSCQCHARLRHQPAALMKTIISACPFDQWEIDIVGPFPIAPAQKKFLLVAIDYFKETGGSRAFG
ncbi:uncharacterized protein LOC142504418 [Primulina tabacum]|uniref:uncharacterized protein LOC142504418 n=1 Tax=Primulina tabacum TaxID=48773 RepID=UPI003F5A20AA